VEQNTKDDSDAQGHSEDDATVCYRGGSTCVSILYEEGFCGFDYQCVLAKDRLE
jgi:hypothetical protein